MVPGIFQLEPKYQPKLWIWSNTKTWTLVNESGKSVHLNNELVTIYTCKQRDKIVVCPNSNYLQFSNDYLFQLAKDLCKNM